MRTSNLNQVKQYIRSARQWFYTTPDRALDQAYDAALKIKAIEDEHFDGDKITSSSNRYSDNVLSYFQSELKRYLKITRIRLFEFKASRTIVSSTGEDSLRSNGSQVTVYQTGNGNGSDLILEKLKFVDEVLDRYKTESPPSTAVVEVNKPATVPPPSPLSPPSDNRAAPSLRVNADTAGTGTVLDKTGVLPRSILGTLNRIKRELDPNSERQIVQNFRSAQAKTIVAVRFILLLIIIPLLTQQVSKVFLIGPIVEHFRNAETAEIFINPELEEEGITELQRFEERLRFQNLITKAPPISQEEIEARVREKADEIALEFRQEGTNAIKNVFADLLSVVAFVILVATNKRQVAVLKSFIDETVYGLSDSAKAFIIILFTDMFVGFHSPHGWEVLLEGFSRHLGLPANRDFIFLFIATFPVILDTIFKYWIFRYLNRISPSAVATYRNMNEG